LRYGLVVQLRQLLSTEGKNAVLVDAARLTVARRCVVRLVNPTIFNEASSVNYNMNLFEAASLAASQPMDDVAVKGSLRLASFGLIMRGSQRSSFGGILTW